MGLAAVSYFDKRGRNRQIVCSCPVFFFFRFQPYYTERAEIRQSAKKDPAPETDSDAGYIKSAGRFRYYGRPGSSILPDESVSQCSHSHHDQKSA